MQRRNVSAIVKADDMVLIHFQAFSMTKNDSVRNTCIKTEPDYITSTSQGIFRTLLIYVSTFMLQLYLCITECIPVGTPLINDNDDDNK